MTDKMIPGKWYEFKSISDKSTFANQAIVNVDIAKQLGNRPFQVIKCKQTGMGRGVTEVRTLDGKKVIREGMNNTLILAIENKFFVEAKTHRPIFGDLPPVETDYTYAVMRIGAGNSLNLVDDVLTKSDAERIASKRTEEHNEETLVVKMVSKFKPVETVKIHAEKTEF